MNCIIITGTSRGLGESIAKPNMQKNIRSTNKDDFLDRDRFLSFKNDGKLLSPDFVALKIIQIMKKTDITNGKVINIKDL